MPSTLTEASFNRAVSKLATQHTYLARAISRWGKPPFWVHPQGFPGLVLAILAQQVSIESADAAFSKLEKAGPVKPKVFLTLDDKALREIGFSRQKARYTREVAQRIMDGRLDTLALERMKDDDVRSTLIQIKGIGPWTADTYLLFSLRRPDAWPPQDIALAKAIRELKRLATIPTWEKLDDLAESWRPWRSVAARILWHHYLCLRGRSVSA